LRCDELRRAKRRSGSGAGVGSVRSARTGWSQRDQRHLQVTESLFGGELPNQWGCARARLLGKKNGPPIFTGGPLTQPH